MFGKCVKKFGTVILHLKIMVESHIAKILNMNIKKKEFKDLKIYATLKTSSLNSKSTLKFLSHWVESD